MKRYLYMLLTALSTIYFCTGCCENCKTTPAIQEDTEEENKLVEVVQEPDQTDVLAIPLDNSEEEEDMEMQQLEQMQTEIQEQKGIESQQEVKPNL